MLNNLKKMINAEAESDLVVDLMLEATNNSIADMFIRDDGEIDMSEKDILDVLDKIPAYDEEAEMNKKLDKIAEFYIPEELKLDPVQESTDSEEECLEEGLIKRDKHTIDKDGKVNVSLTISKNGDGFKAEGDIYGQLVMAFPIPAPEKVLKGRKLKKYIRQDIETMFKDPKFSKYRIGKIKMVKGLAEAYEWEDDDVELESFEWDDNDYESYLESFDSDYDYDDYLEEGLLGKFKEGIKKRKGERLLKDPKKFKKHMEKIRKNVMKDLNDVKDPEEAKKIIRCIKDFLEEDDAFKDQPADGIHAECQAMWDSYTNWLRTNIIPSYEKIANGNINESFEYKEDNEMSEEFDKYLESLSDDGYEYEDYLEEGLGGFKYRKMSNEDLRAKIEELEAEGNNVEAGKYQKELDRRLKKDSKKEARAEKKAAKAEAKAAKKAAKNGGEEEAPAAESWEEYLESFVDIGYDEYLEEGLLGGFKYRKMSNSDLRAKIDELELAGNEIEAGKYKKELERRLKKDEKKKAKEGVVVPGTEPANKVAESWEEYLESFVNDKESL